MSEKGLVELLIEAQAEMETPKFDSVNPHFKSRYASLGAIMAVVKPPLEKRGIRLSQPIVDAGDGRIAVETRVSNGEGGFGVIGYFPLPDVTDPQKIGSAITYARRYSLSCAFALVAEEDDDGNAASAKEPPKGEFDAVCTACGTRYHFTSFEQMKKSACQCGNRQFKGVS